MMDEKAAVEYEAWINQCYSESGNGDAERFDFDVRNLVAKAEQWLEMQRIGYFQVPDATEELQKAVEAVKAWYEETDDPSKNGWVDSKGRP